jgi:hypothetical protein
MGWSAIRRAALSVTFIVIAGVAAGQEVQGLHGPAATVIKAEIGRQGLAGPVDAHVFYGDLTGTGTEDAIAFVYYESGGSGVRLSTWIWRERGGEHSLAAAPSIDQVFGLDPRDVEFSPGRIEVTMTVPRPDDPRCCPTGQRRFVLTMDDAGGAGGAAALDVPIVGHGGDGQTADCSSRTIVVGLNPGGDGFLAVRTGPGTQYRKIDELRNGEVVYGCDARGDWIAIVYGPSKAKKGWVHGRWLAG